MRDVSFDNSSLYNPSQLPLPELATAFPEEEDRPVLCDLIVPTEEDLEEEAPPRANVKSSCALALPVGTT